MALMDEFREERERIKKAPLKTKASYFWHYYKWHIIIPLLIISFIIWCIISVMTKRDTILNGVFLNAHSMDATTLSEELAADFCKEHKINTEDYAVTLNTSLSFDGNNIENTANYETVQVLMAWIGAGTLDFVAGDTNALTVLAYANYLVDLRKVLSDEDFAKYEPYFLYIDEAVLHAEDIISDYPDCTKPEEMERPIPVLIDISASDEIAKLYPGVKPIILGVAANAPNTETLSDFLDYLDK